MNDALRSHVTRVGFDLTLTKTQIEAMVWLYEMIRRQHWRDGVNRGPRLFVTAIGACIARGLVDHHYNPDPVLRAHDKGPEPHYTFTRAGVLVLGLLRESGLYDEYRERLGLDRFVEVPV